MKVGDIVRWGDHLGIILNMVEKLYAVDDHIYFVCWSDGGYSRMYKDELEVISECG